MTSFLKLRRSGSKRQPSMRVGLTLFAFLVLYFEHQGIRLSLLQNTTCLELERGIPPKTKEEYTYREPTEDEIYVNSLVCKALELSEQNNTALFELNQSQVVRKLLSDTKRCSLNFHGLPRAFRTRVLPSIIRNILIPNAVYNCDVIVYYHHLRQEDAGRSGHGGTLDPDAVHLLRLAVLEVAERARPGGVAAAATAATVGVAADAKPTMTTSTTIATTTTTHRKMRREPTVVISNFTDSAFFEKQGELLNKTRTRLDEKGNSIYVPYAPSFDHATTDNVIRMFHSIQGAFEVMERTSRELGISYIRVGIFRDDVFYATPIDIFQHPVSSDEENGRLIDQDNKIAVVPGFAQYPVNDRMFYGPYEACKIYATRRFEVLEDHVHKRIGSGWGLHPETFLNETIFPMIRNTGISIVTDPTICFVRARADLSLWINDCGEQSLPGGPSFHVIMAHVEETLELKCRQALLKGKSREGVVQALCE